MNTATRLVQILKRDSPHTTSALNAASHNGFDEGANVFIFHGSFALCETASVAAKLHGLILHTKCHSVLVINP